MNQDGGLGHLPQAVSGLRSCSLCDTSIWNGDYSETDNGYICRSCLFDLVQNAPADIQNELRKEIVEQRREERRIEMGAQRILKLVSK